MKVNAINDRLTLIQSKEGQVKEVRMVIPTIQSKLEIDSIPKDECSKYNWNLIPFDNETPSTPELYTLMMNLNIDSVFSMWHDATSDSFGLYEQSFAELSNFEYVPDGYLKLTFKIPADAYKPKETEKEATVA